MRRLDLQLTANWTLSPRSPCEGSRSTSGPIGVIPARPTLPSSSESRVSDHHRSHGSDQNRDRIQRIGDQRAAMAVRASAEVRQRILPQQGEGLDLRPARDRERPAGIGPRGQLRPGELGRGTGEGKAPQVDLVAGPDLSAIKS
jgi:hypothetical protein